jgi:hypothetical protein
MPVISIDIREGRRTPSLWRNWYRTRSLALTFEILQSWCGSQFAREAVDHFAKRYNANHKIIMVRTPALVRQWNLLRVLSQHFGGLSIEEMAARTSVNSRTIRRDLRVFLDAGIPLRETIGRRNKKTWRVELQRTSMLDGYSTEEYLALSLTERFLEPLRQTGYFDAFSRCRLRAARNIAKSVRMRVEKLVEEFSLGNAESIRTVGSVVAEKFREATDPTIVRHDTSETESGD